MNNGCNLLMCSSGRLFVCNLYFSLRKDKHAHVRVGIRCFNGLDDVDVRHPANLSM